MVNYAARVVGSLHGQLAKLAGRRVIGFAGTDEILLIVLLVVRVEIDSITAKPYILQKSLLQ